MATEFEKTVEKSFYLQREDLQENIVIIKINKLYREGMSAEALYETTRGIWKRNLKSLGYLLASVFEALLSIRF